MARKSQYTEAEKKARRSATQKKYYARKKAAKNLKQAEAAVKTAEAAYTRARSSYLASLSQTPQDAYFADPQGWEEIGSPIAEFLDEFGYNDKTLIEIRDELKQRGFGDGYLMYDICMTLLSFVGISRLQIEYMEAEKDYTAAQNNLISVQAQYINTFNKSLNAWL